MHVHVAHGWEDAQGMRGAVLHAKWRRMETDGNGGAQDQAQRRTPWMGTSCASMHVDLQR